MLKEYDGQHMNQCMALWNIARELSRKNDLLEIEMLCKTAEAIRSSAKSSTGNLHYDGWKISEELACTAYKKIMNICNSSKTSSEDNS